MATDAKPVVRRSRAGCAECRRRRRRCDESKPSCRNCLMIGHECKYLVELSWGGRPFARSIFGQCMGADDGVSKIATSTQSNSKEPFIYGTKALHESPKNSRTKQPVAVRSKSNDRIFVPESDSDPAVASDKRVELARNSRKTLLVSNSSVSRAVAPSLGFIYPSRYKWIPPQSRDLVTYFTEKMIQSVSCYNAVQTGYCSTVLPMAASSPHVLAAVLYLAACHKSSRGYDQSPYETSKLRASSLRQLRLSIEAPDAKTNIEAALAATLTLCVADIVSDVATPGSWRIHMEGALTLWAHLIKSPTWKSRKDSESIQFLKRWYSSFELVSCGCGVLPVKRFLSELESQQPEEDFVDDNNGFSTALYPLLEQLNILRAARNIVYPRSRLVEIKTEQALPDIQGKEDTCQILIDRVEQRLANPTKRFRPGFGEGLPDDIRRDYYSCDEGYHRMVLLQLYACSIKKIPASLVRFSVRRILDVISTMKFVDEPCPAVAILPALFVAGTQAWEAEDQEKVTKILARMELCWGMGNVRGARSTLAQVWELQAQIEEKGPFPWEFVIEDDILPY